MNGWSNKPSFVVGLFRFLCYGAGLFWLPFFSKSDGSDVVSNSGIDFEEYELHGSIQLDRISEGVKHRTMATQFFSVYVRSSEWSIAVSEDSKRNPEYGLMNPEIYWYGNKHESICWNKTDDPKYDHVSLYPFHYPISNHPEDSLSLLYMMFASRNLSALQGSDRLPVLHDWEARVKYWELISLQTLRDVFAVNSSFPTNIVVLNDVVSAENEKHVDDEFSRAFDSNGKRSWDIYFNKFRVPSGDNPTNAWYRAHPPRRESNRWIPTGFEALFWNAEWRMMPSVDRRAEATVQRFSPKCSLKELKPQIRRETGVGDMRLWVESPPVFQEGQGYEIPTYTLMPGEDWPTVEEAKFRLKHPDRRTKPQPWGFVLVGAIVGVPLLWAARRYSRKA
jgi:hypothetical protein